MELRHLRYFVAVAEELHFGRAALRLGISQPPLSQQIAALETEVSARLFNRDKRNVVLTPAGKLFLVEARAALKQVDRARDVARRAQSGELGELRIGLFGSAPLATGVSDSIGSFRALLPDVSLILRELDSAQQIEHLQTGALDAGFIRQHRTPILPSALSAIQVTREPLHAILPQSHALASDDGPLPLAELADEPFVFFPHTAHSSMHEQVYSLCRDAGFLPRIVQEANANAMIVGLVAAGVGVSILPAALCRSLPAGVHTRPLDAPGATTACWLGYCPKATNPLAQRFVEHVRARGLSQELAL